MVKSKRSPKSQSDEQGSSSVTAGCTSIPVSSCREITRGGSISAETLIAERWCGFVRLFVLFGWCKLSESRLGILEGFCFVRRENEVIVAT